MRLLIFGGDASGSIQQLQTGTSLKCSLKEDGMFNMMQTKNKMRVTQEESGHIHEKPNMA